VPEKETQVLQFIQNGDLEPAKKLLWHSGGTQDWFSTMAPLVENAGDGYARSDPARAIRCYERARDLYEAENAGATSGGEGMALLMEGRGSHLGRKIWLLKN
jgi:hypothetical protein